MLTDTGNNAMHKDLKDIIDEKRIAELATSENAQEAFFGKNGLIKQLIKNTLETALKAELAHHLEQTDNSKTPNKRNGKTLKTIQAESGTFE